MRGLKIKVDVEQLRNLVSETVIESIGKTLGEMKVVLSKTRKISDLNEEIEQLRIEKDRREWEFEKKEMELEHKIGLEKKRQEFEIDQAKRETKVEVQEANLAAERKRFEEQMEFERSRLEGQIKDLNTLANNLLKRLPSAEIFAEIQSTRKTTRKVK